MFKSYDIAYGDDYESWDGVDRETRRIKFNWWCNLRYYQEGNTEVGWWIYWGKIKRINGWIKVIRMIGFDVLRIEWWIYVDEDSGIGFMNRFRIISVLEN